MFTYQLTQYAFQGQLLQTLMRDIDDVDLARQPSPGMNHPAWIVGHLTLVSELSLMQHGHMLLTPEEERPLYRPGSEPQPDRSIYPAKSVLVERFVAVHEQMLQTVPRISADFLSQPHGLPMEALKALPTQGHLLSHVLTTHEALHLGQLSALRRAMGFKPLF